MSICLPICRSFVSEYCTKLSPCNIQIRYKAPHLRNLNDNGKVDTLFFMFHALSFSVLATIISLRYA